MSILPGDTYPMAKYRKRPVVVEAITFDELVKHGVDSGATVNLGMPWSFRYNGLAITHETDDLYLISHPTGTLRFRRGEMLITQEDGDVYPCPKATFDSIYDRVADPIPQPKPLPAWHRLRHRLMLWLDPFPPIGNTRPK